MKKKSPRVQTEKTTGIKPCLGVKQKAFVSLPQILAFVSTLGPENKSTVLSSVFVWDTLRGFEETVVKG